MWYTSLAQLTTEMMWLSHNGIKVIGTNLKTQSIRKKWRITLSNLGEQESRLVSRLTTLSGSLLRQMSQDVPSPWIKTSIKLQDGTSIGLQVKVTEYPK